VRFTITPLGGAGRGDQIVDARCLVAGNPITAVGVSEIAPAAAIQTADRGLGKATGIGLLY
jgi:hypothetical protein